MGKRRKGPSKALSGSPKQPSQESAVDADIAALAEAHMSLDQEGTLTSDGKQPQTGAPSHPAAEEQLHPGQDDGHADGHADGHDDGHDDGHADGHLPKAAWSELALSPEPPDSPQHPHSTTTQHPHCDASSTVSPLPSPGGGSKKKKKKKGRTGGSGGAGCGGAGSSAGCGAGTNGKSSGTMPSSSSTGLPKAPRQPPLPVHRGRLLPESVRPGLLLDQMHREPLSPPPVTPPPDSNANMRIIWPSEEARMRSAQQGISSSWQGGIGSTTTTGSIKAASTSFMAELEAANQLLLRKNEDKTLNYSDLAQHAMLLSRSRQKLVERSQVLAHRYKVVCSLLSKARNGSAIDKYFHQMNEIEEQQRRLQDDVQMFNCTQEQFKSSAAWHKVLSVSSPSLSSSSSLSSSFVIVVITITLGHLQLVEKGKTDFVQVNGSYIYMPPDPAEEAPLSFSEVIEKELKQEEQRMQKKANKKGRKKSACQEIGTDPESASMPMNDTAHSESPCFPTSPCTE